MSKIRFTTYLHGDKDSMYEELVNVLGREEYKQLPRDVQRELEYALYEIEFELEIDTSNGSSRIIKIMNGKDEFRQVNEGAAVETSN